MAPLAGCKASFKNSRNYPRTATLTDAMGPDVDVLIEAGGVQPNGNTLIAPPNTARTFLTIYNWSALPVRLRRATDIAITFAPGAETGFLVPAGASYDLEGPEAVYGAAQGGTARISVDEGSG